MFSKHNSTFFIIICQFTAEFMSKKVQTRKIDDRLKDGWKYLTLFEFGFIMYKFEKLLVKFEQSLKWIAVGFIGQIQFVADIFHYFKESFVFGIANLGAFVVFQIISENTRREDAKFSQLLMGRLLLICEKSVWVEESTI
jgi:hypothetical protein